MARNAPKVYLGFEDEEVTDQNKHLVDYTTNKIGGQPNFPGPEIKIPSCPICGLRRALIAQIYAPLDNSPFHRTLYIFSCVNAVCSNQPLGWTCIRVQHLDRQSPPAAAAAVGAEEQRRAKAPKPNIKWCSGADDWGDEDDGDSGAVGGIHMEMDEVAAAVDALQLSAGPVTDANCNEPNGNVLMADVAAANVVGRNDNRPSNAMSDDEEEAEELEAGEEEEEDEDESNSLASDDAMLVMIRDQAAVQLPLQMPPRNDNDRNANGGGGGQKKPPPDEVAAKGAIGAVGRLQPNCGASAEIEGVEDDDELVTIDAPVQPKRDLIALLKQTNAVPTDPRKVVLKSYFVAVAEEERSAATSGAMGEHVRELLLEYQSRDEKNALSPGSPAASGGAAGGGGGGGGDGDEKYEKAVPAHGDLYFHNFISTLHENPGQLLRYTRDALPLLVAPLPERKWPPCGHCGAPMICELQLLSTLIPTLRFAATGDAAPLEFYNVLVFTCEKSCWDTPDQWRSEPIVVQPDV